MKKKLVFLLIVMSSAMSILSKDVVFDTILLKNNIFSYNVFDTLQVIAYSRPKWNNSYLFINGKEIDSSGLQIRSLPVYYKGEIFFNADRIERELEINKYNLKKVKLSESFNLVRFNYKFFHDNSYKQFYIKEKPYTKISTVTPTTGEKDQFIDLWNIVKKENINGEKYPAEAIGDVFFIDPRKAIVTLCSFDEIGSCINKRYLLCKKKDVRDITEQLLSNFNKNLYERVSSSIDFVNKEGDLIREKLTLRNKKTNEKTEINRLFDANLNYVSDLLVLKRPIVMGVNIQNGKLQNHFLRSFLNNKEKVIIPYKFIPQLDLAMYKAHQNNKLTEEDIEGLDLYALGILRNSIFAKYNYAFNSEFYQAYFNLFAFYNHSEKKGKRTKNVNEKLSETDKANVAFVLKAEKKLKE